MLVAFPLRSSCLSYLKWVIDMHQEGCFLAKEISLFVVGFFLLFNTICQPVPRYQVFKTCPSKSQSNLKPGFHLCHKWQWWRKDSKSQRGYGLLMAKWLKTVLWQGEWMRWSPEVPLKTLPFCGSVNLLLSGGQSETVSPSSGFKQLILL